MTRIDTSTCLGVASRFPVGSYGFQNGTQKGPRSNRGNKTPVELFWHGVMTSFEPLAEKYEALTAL